MILWITGFDNYVDVTEHIHCIPSVTSTYSSRHVIHSIEKVNWFNWQFVKSLNLSSCPRTYESSGGWKIVSLIWSNIYPLQYSTPILCKKDHRHTVVVLAQLVPLEQLMYGWLRVDFTNLILLGSNTFFKRLCLKSKIVRSTGIHWGDLTILPIVPLL